MAALGAKRALACALAVLLGLPALGAGTPTLLKAAGKITKQDAEERLSSELAPPSDGQARLAQLEDALRATFASLPKNADGRLEHQAVRYALHRLFVQRRGWYIRGLEPGAERHAPAAGAEEWVPSYLQALLERREHELNESGTDLRELAALAATLEDLAAQEATGRLQAAYRLHGLEPAGKEEAREVRATLRTFYVAFLVAGNFSAASLEEAQRKELRFAKKYTGWLEAEEWLNELEEQSLSADGEGMIDFPAAQRTAAEIGQRYYEFNDRECRDLKATLLTMEGSKAGRVRLPTFYKKSLYSHWRFDEKIEYLRSLGALDESNPKQPQVITANYIMARTNCLEAYGLYAICCRNECEDLMTHLEREVGSSAAKPARVAELVAALPSNTVQAPRNLSAQLLDRLVQVAAVNGGQVPLHGRLFAQWMHHAYPRECPYPHEAGVANPQTPDEWIRETGHKGSSASPEELWAVVASDTCAATPNGGPGCGDEDAELPWSEAEELLTVAPAQGYGRADMAAADGWASLALRASAILALALLVLAGRSRWARDQGWPQLPPQACLGLAAFLAFCPQLLESTAVALGLLGGVLAVVSRLVLGRLTALQPSCKKLAYADDKCCV
mmetsp:Transcript_21825/g.68905  ORF Transcript_21825/g.68905 Transcript_21825/m.68905 type:complete len:618 (+) Transcript_21825:97-1950(+)